MRRLERAMLIANRGIQGDRYCEGTGHYSEEGFGHQISLFESEIMDTLLRDHKVTLTPEMHRRNITVRGVPLTHLVGKTIRIGGAVLRATKFSTPCLHLNDTTGMDIFNIMINRSGLYFTILEGGGIDVGASVSLLT
jgi:MOSC domain-containing protein YiiM